MKIFYNHSGNILTAVKRFPAVFVLTFCASICLATDYLWMDILKIQGIDASEDIKQLALIPKAMGMSSLWCALLSFPAQLLAELSKKKILQTLVQIFCMALCFAWYFVCSKTESRWTVIYYSTLMALISICPFMLRKIQRDNEIVLNIISSLFQSFLIAMSITIALLVIHFSVSTLFSLSCEIISFIFTPLYFLCWISIFVDYFVINASKHHIDITIPRFMGMLFSAVLTPLFAVFLIVLYAYLIKCGLTHSFPMKDMNMFCSIATALYILFAMTLSFFDTKPSRMFYRIAPFAVIPLIIVQILITVDRVSAHGISVNRYASMLYILFSMVAVILSIIKHRAYLIYICPVFAMIALIAGISPLNIIDVPLRSQTKIVYSVLKRNGLYKDGIILKEKTKEVLSVEDKTTISRAYNKIKGIDESPFKKFEETFGFPIANYKEDSKNKYVYKINVPHENKPINISAYGQMFIIDYENKDNRIFLNYAGNLLDITDTVKKHFIQSARISSNDYKHREEPLILKDSKGYTCIIMKLNSFTKEELTVEQFEGYKTNYSDLSISCYGINGYAFK